MAPKQDPLAAALAATTVRRGGTPLRVDKLFGDRPEVLDAIRQARRRGVSHESIAQTLSTPEESVSDEAVRNWLLKQGVR